jgi:hypothetical protein
MGPQANSSVIATAVINTERERLEGSSTGSVVDRTLCLTQTPAHLTEQAGSARISPSGHWAGTRCWNGRYVLFIDTRFSKLYTIVDTSA